MYACMYEQESSQRPLTTDASPFCPKAKLDPEACPIEEMLGFRGCGAQGFMGLVALELRVLSGFTV